MIDMTLEKATRILRAADVVAGRYGKPFSISIVDEAGRLVLFQRADGAGFLTVDTSCAKAVAAASFKRSTSDVNEHRDANPLLWFSLPAVTGGRALPSPGGVPVFERGRCIGAVGVGGGSPDEDDAIARAGAAALADD